MSKLIITLRDEEIFPVTLLGPIRESKVERQRVKGIIHDKDGNIAMVWAKTRLLPGGGVELEDKNLIEALRRECLEEIGCEVEVGEEIGWSDEYRLRSKTKEPSHQTIHCFIGKVIGEKGKPQTAQEDELDMEVNWFPLDEVIKIMEDQLQTISPELYHSNYNIRGQLAFLKEYKENYADRR